MGVSFDKQRNKFKATVTRNGKQKQIGRFETYAKAQRALRKYRREQEALKEDELQEKLNKMVWQDNHPWGSMDFEVYKPSVWDRIKAQWASIRQRR